jgi:hypothetical protein
VGDEVELPEGADTKPPKGFLPPWRLFYLKRAGKILNMFRIIRAGISQYMSWFLLDNRSAEKAFGKKERV